MPVDPGTVILFRSDLMGSGPAELGEVLLGAFLKTLLCEGRLPREMLFVTDGVKLVCEGSRHLDTLRALASAGVSLKACGTCLDYFRLKEKVASGEVSNMSAIAAALFSAKRVIEP